MAAAIKDTQTSIDDAWQMLRFIPAVERDVWVRIGMILKSEYSDLGFSIFDQWSQTAANYNAKDVRDVWRSFRSSGVGFGSLVFLAQQSGWAKNLQPVAAPSPAVKKPTPPGRDTSAYAIDLFKRSNKEDSFIMAHPYAINKDFMSAAGGGRVIASGKVIGKNTDCLIAPIRNIETDQIQGVQCINAEGAKQTFGSVTGGALLLGNMLNKSLIWYVAEGWASAYSVVFHHQKGNGVCACSFGKHNQHAAAQKIEEIYRPASVVNLLEQD